MDAAGLVQGHDSITVAKSSPWLIVIAIVIIIINAESFSFVLTASVTEALIKTFFDKKVGDFLKAQHLRSAFVVINSVDQGNLRIDPSSGQFQLKKEGFDNREADLQIKARSTKLRADIPAFANVMTQLYCVSLQILIRNVFFVFGPHTTDWSWAHVKQELKPSKKAKKSGEDSATGWLSDIQTRIKQDAWAQAPSSWEDLMKKVAEMIEAAGHHTA
ncbi:hypothetical protein AK812_SmicGene16562 [Symbiodinium microadriaticum]|uniref:Uncharacterized protein n=1 Tax=Symbiodinium microadriaticum TaxID=2951 RepID=A0A1Q9E004_SYMMI|nr:hypothetical protein AK812_SmicGene16562 [Symbiodinium microadriaticum]